MSPDKTIFLHTESEVTGVNTTTRTEVTPTASSPPQVPSAPVKPRAVFSKQPNVQKSSRFRTTTTAFVPGRGREANKHDRLLGATAQPKRWPRSCSLPLLSSVTFSGN